MSRIHRKTLVALSIALSVALLATCLSTSLTFAQSGAWTLVSSPSVGTNGNHLFGVAAISANDIWAVGDYNDGPNMYHSRTLTEHWNGSTWSIVPSPNPATGNSDDDQLQAVAAVSASNVWAVGYVSNNNTLNTETLIEHWNGTAWSVVPSPNPTVSQYLYAVAVISASDIWAVGAYSDQQRHFGALTLHWNGSTWSRVSNPGTDTLRGITAVSSNDVWAVGDYSSEIMHWNGTSWSVLNIPPGTFGTLTAVAAVSATDIWAVGYEYEYYSFPVIAHWNGKAWTEVYTPYRNNEDNIFYGVAALSATSVWAVGLSGGQTLVEKWNGKHWAIVSSPNANTFDRFQAATAVPAAGDVWAVGYDLQNSAVGRTLTQQCLTC